MGTKLIKKNKNELFFPSDIDKDKTKPVIKGDDEQVIPDDNDIE